MGKKIFVIIILLSASLWVFKFWTSEVSLTSDVVFKTSEVELGEGSRAQPGISVEVLTSEVSIGNIKLNVQIADSPAERELGLSGRDGLAEDEGLLFVFDSLGFYNFWMKDMKFPIDVIWMDEDWRVADFKTAISPTTYPELFTSSQPAKYVLEVNSGWVNKNNIMIGDTVHTKL